jgi:hypothetical protein
MANQPDLGTLLNAYLQRQADAHALGLAARETPGEVVLHEAGPAQPVDARLAWEEALTAAALLVPGAETTLQAPPFWSTLVASHDPSVAVPLCLGNFPQLVRDLRPLLQSPDLSKLRAPSSRAVSVPGLEEWSAEASRKKQFPQVLLAAALLRLAGQFEQAGNLLQAHHAEVPAKWRAVWDNEQAALKWQKGECATAQVLWNTQAPSVPVLFNRGMVALFLGAPAEAPGFLNQAVIQLPEDSAWHHLGRLYLALAEASGAA